MTAASLKIELVDLGSKWDGEVSAGMITQDWEELVQVFTRHDVRLTKDGPCFMPVRMKPREEWILSKPRPGTKTKPGYRNDDNVEAVTMVVLDLDKEGAREKAEEAFQGLEYVLYSTFSHSAGSPYKHRLVMPIVRPISTADWPLVFRVLAHHVGADLQCSNVSRIFYYPSASPDAGISALSRHQRGRILDVEPLIKPMRNAPIMPLPKKAPTVSGKPGHPGRRPPAPHFAGTTYLPNPDNYRLYALERRHRPSIIQLKRDDSRHHFALTVIAREIARLGPRTDLTKLMQFLFYGARKYSSRGMDTGNTIEEIPELVLSAWQKFQARGGEAAHISIGNAVSEAIATAFEAQQLGHWDFADAPGPPPPTLHVDAPTEDPVVYAHRLIEEGLHRMGSELRLADVARNCLDTLCPTDPHYLARELTAAADQIRPEAGPWSEEQFRRFWRGALARSLASSPSVSSDTSVAPP